MKSRFVLFYVTSVNTCCTHQLCFLRISVGPKVTSLVQSRHVWLTRFIMFDDLAQIQWPGEEFKGKRMNFLLQISLWFEMRLNSCEAVGWRRMCYEKTPKNSPMMSLHHVSPKCISFPTSLVAIPLGTGQRKTSCNEHAQAFSPISSLYADSSKPTAWTLACFHWRMWNMLHY